MHAKRFGALLAVAAVGCIERPWERAPARRAVDREVLGDVLLAAPPADMTPVGAVFGNAVELVGFKLEPPALAPTRAMNLTLYWRCLAELDAWHVFVHLDDAEGNGARIHREHDPAGGRFPTDAWKPGDLVADAITFPGGNSPFLLYLGLYAQGENRLQLTSPGRGRDDGNNRLLAAVLPTAAK